MPRPNRVTPFGTLAVVPERGAFMGNRGCLHDAEGRIRRRWATRAWICCVLSFKDRRVPLDAPGRYTPLFFLDEATALAAGHRPCAECRRADYLRFRARWAEGNGWPGLPFAPDMDRRLHADRQSPHTAALAGLPDGTMVAPTPSAAMLLWRGRLHAWSHAGYGPPEPAPATAAVLTPRSTVAALAAGYRPHTAPLPA